MTDLSRRAVLQVAAGAVAAGRTAAEAVAQAASTLAAPLAAVASESQGVTRGLANAQVRRTAEQIAAEALREVMHQRKQERKRFQRTGFDPDIASLRLPRATLARMQIARDRAEQSAIDGLEDLIYPHRIKRYGYDQPAPGSADN